MDECGASHGGLADERIEHSPCRVSDGKEFPGVFAFEFYACRPEEGHRIVGCEPREHFADRRWRAAGKIGVGHTPVGDVAAAAAGHENLGTQFPGGVHGQD